MCILLMDIVKIASGTSLSCITFYKLFQMFLIFGDGVDQDVPVVPIDNLDRILVPSS